MQKHTRALLIGIPALLLLILLIFFTPLNGLFRGDLGPESKQPGPSGLYLQNTMDPKQAGSGATLSSPLSLNERGEIPVYLSHSLAKGTKKYVISGSLSYDPNSLSITKDRISSSSGYIMDSFLMHVDQDEKGHERGTLTFSFEAEHATSSPLAGIFYFTPQVKNVKNSIWLQTLAITDHSSANKQNILYLSRVHPVVTLISKALHVDVTGIDTTWQTFSKEGSGTVIQSVRTLPSGTIFTKKTWTIVQQDSGEEEEHVTEESISKEGKRLLFLHHIFSKNKEEKEIETATGARIRTSTDGLGRIQAHSESGTGNSLHTTNYYYSMQKITTEEWWKKNMLPQIHVITYPNGDKQTSEYIRDQNTFQVKTTFTTTQGSSTILWNKKEKEIRAQVGPGASPLKQDSMTKDLGNCRVFLSQNALLQEMSVQFSDGAEDTAAHVQNVCTLRGFAPTSAYELREFFLPLTLKFPVTGTEHLTPVRLNEQTGQWEDLESWQALSEDTTSIKILLLKTGRYGLKSTLE